MSLILFEREVDIRILLVEDLEKDFNVTLPQAISQNKGVDAVRSVVEAMQAKLDKARALLVETEKSRNDVF